MKFYIILGLIVVGIIGVTATLSAKPSNSTQQSLARQTTSPNTPRAKQTLPNQANKPNFTLASLDGQIIDNQHFSGKPTILKLGTTYCHVCQQEIPEMKQAHQQLGDQANIVFVLIGASQKQARDYIDRYDLPYPVYLDSGATGRTFDVLGTPTHAILSKDGTLANRRVGFMSFSQITDELTKLL